MAIDVLDIPAPIGRSRRGTIALLSLAALIAVVFVGAAAVPYFLSSCRDRVRRASKAASSLTRQVCEPTPAFFHVVEPGGRA